MSQQGKPLVGSIFERKPSSSTSALSTPKATVSKTGFPTAQHQSKSVFARGREAQQQSAVVSSRAIEPPVVQPSLKKQGPTPSEGTNAGDWRVQMSEENEGRVAAMTEEEREEGRREIEEKFGKNIGDVLRRVRMAREADEMQKRAVASLERDLGRSLPDANSKIAPSVPPGEYRDKMMFLQV